MRWQIKLITYGYEPPITDASKPKKQIYQKCSVATEHAYTLHRISSAHLVYIFFNISDFVDVYLNQLVNPIPINQTHLYWKSTVRKMVMVMIMLVTIKDKQINLASHHLSFPCELSTYTSLFLETDWDLWVLLWYFIRGRTAEAWEQSLTFLYYCTRV